MAIRVAVVGLGGIGRNHVQIYADHPKAELVGVCDILPDRAKAASEQWQVPAFHDLDQMLADLRPDAVSVATAGVENGGDHFGPSMAALRAGAHVLCEKPLSNDLTEAKTLVHEARRLGRCLAVDLNHRFSPATAAAKSRQDGGDLGQLLFVRTYLWIGNRKESAPYFHLRALHSHSVDVMQYFGGPVSEVQAMFARGPRRQIWSNAVINLRFAGGALGQLLGSYDMGGTQDIEQTLLAGTGGELLISNATCDLTWRPHRGAEEVHIRHVGGQTSFGETMGRRLGRWLDQLAADTDPREIEGSGLEALRAQAVVEAAIRSHETGGALVRIEDVLGDVPGA